MRAWAVDVGGPMSTGPLIPIDLETPVPGDGEVLLHVSACGVCRTDLHLAEGDLSPHRARTVPGHEVVGVVEELGSGCERFTVGQRIGIAWLRHTCGRCHWCRRGAENLCVAPRFTGWDADGGFAEYAVVDEAYAYELPESFDDIHVAPLLCAGIIGYRSWEARRTATRRKPGDLRLRRVRAPRRSGRAGARSDGARPDAGAGGTGARPIAGCALRRAGRRAAARTRRRRDPLRSRR